MSADGLTTPPNEEVVDVDARQDGAYAHHDASVFAQQLEKILDDNDSVHAEWQKDSFDWQKRTHNAVLQAVSRAKDATTAATEAVGKAVQMATNATMESRHKAAMKKQEAEYEEALRHKDEIVVKAKDETIAAQSRINEAMAATMAAMIDAMAANENQRELAAELEKALLNKKSAKKRFAKHSNRHSPSKADKMSGRAVGSDMREITQAVTTEQQRLYDKIKADNSYYATRDHRHSNKNNETRPWY